MDNPPEHEPQASWHREANGEGDSSIEENWLFRLRRERYVSRVSGKSHAYYVMQLADVVQAIALTPSKEVVLVRQFRAGSGRDSLEPPGGLVEAGENPCAAGERELIQETGYAGDRTILLGWAWSNPSIMTSRIFTVFVENAVKVTDPCLDPGEEVRVELAPAAAIPRMIEDGRIDHTLSVLGLFWWLNARSLGPLGIPAPAPKWTILRVMIAIAAIGIVCGMAAGLIRGELLPTIFILAIATPFVLNRWMFRFFFPMPKRKARPTPTRKPLPPDPAVASPTATTDDDVSE